VISRGRAAVRLLVAAMVGLCAVVALAKPANAHSGVESYVYLELFETSIEGRIEYPIADLNAVLGLAIPQDETGALAGIESSLDLIYSYAEDHFSIGDGTTTWPIVFDSFQVLEASAGSYAVFHFEVVQTFDPVPRSFTVFYDGIIEAKPARAGLLLIATDIYSGTFRNEADHLLRFTAENTTQVVDLDDRSWLKGLMAVVGLGVEHIRIGSDHILFVLALLLPSVLAFRKPQGWESAPDARASLWRVLKIVTMFTVAHSITLTLGGLGLVEISPRLVETIIALSIALAALHNLRPVFLNKEWLLAFGFGLFHGFGFAGLLSELGLDRSNRFLSLFGFNLGIEIGQAAIILMAFPALFLLRRTRVYLPAMRTGSVVLSVIALAWAVERLFEVELGVSRIVDPLLAWPRALWLVLVVTMVAAGLFAYDRSRGLLRPLPTTIEPERHRSVERALEPLE
jgi:HupE / UreJ protein